MSLSSQVFQTIFQQDSFIEVLKSPDNHQVLTGYGTISGKLVFGIFQDGIMDLRHIQKIEKIYDLSLKTGSPIISFFNSEGIELENQDTFYGLGNIFRLAGMSKGLIPQICVINGLCMGSFSYLTSIYDFVFMDSTSQLFLESPRGFKDCNYDFDGSFHKGKGLVDYIFHDEMDLISSIENLFNIFPRNNKDIFFEQNKLGDPYKNPILDLQLPTRKIIEELSDGIFFHYKKGFGRDITTSLILLDGYPTGIIGFDGKLSVCGMEKANNFINLCNNFSIPIITIINGQGYNNSVDHDSRLIKIGGQLICSFVKCKVPKINLVLSNSFGGTDLIINSKTLGADYVFTISGVKISSFDNEVFSKILNIKHGTGNQSRSDEIIEKEEIREKLINTLNMLANKRDFID